MHFEDTLSIQAPRQKVWDFLTDPNKVADCAPGLESLEIVEPDKKFRATIRRSRSVRSKVRFVNDVEWVDLDPPNRAQMKAHGTAPGSGVDAKTSMTLTDGEAGATVLTWTADIDVVGTVASMAARLMGGVTKKLTAEFFNAVRKDIEKT